MITDTELAEAISAWAENRWHDIDFPKIIKDFKTLKSMLAVGVLQYSAVLKEKEELQEILAFYADEINYDDGDNSSPVDLDHGYRAREALGCEE